MSAIKENWRIGMLILFLLASAFALFGPIGQSSATTQTDFVALDNQSTVDMENSSLLLENTTLETTNDSTDTIVARDATIEVEGNVTSVSNSSAVVSRGTISVSGGTVISPRNTTQITATNSTISVRNAVLQTENSELTVSVQRQADTGPTNLQYGLDLSGGTRIRAPLVGLHVTDLSLGQNTSVINQQLAAELSVDPIDVQVSRGSGTVEVFDDDVSRQEFAAALQSVGFQVETADVATGVTKSTRQDVVETLQDKIDRTGLSGGTVSTVGDGLVVVEVPNTTPDQVRDIVNDRGIVRVVAEVRDGNTTSETTVLTADDIANIGIVGQRSNGAWEVPVTVKDSSAERFQQQMRALGFTGPGVGRCARTSPGVSGDSWCLLTTLDGDLVRANSMGSGLAQDLESGSWASTPTFTIGAPTVQSAEELKISMQVGSLPTKLNLSGSQFDISYVQPSLAQKFKPFSLLTGLIAWLAVSGMVFFRYKKAGVAIPMLLTAGAEVFILLGFASITGLALNLSHIAGLIAVIGTGVDDLIIIADEILQSGDVATGRVFKSRFRKAFWVIGAAAATTIIAMSPLTILSVGDLFGFAVVTIVGVLIGVLITRPAYGDILRNLVLDES